MDQFYYEMHQNGIYKLTIMLSKQSYTAMISEKNIKSMYFRIEDFGALLSGEYTNRDKVRNYKFTLNCNQMNLCATLVVEIESAEAEYKDEIYFIKMKLESAYERVLDKIENTTFKIKQLNNLSKYILDTHQRFPEKITPEKFSKLAGRVSKVQRKLTDAMTEQTLLKQYYENKTVRTPPLTESFE